MDLDMMIMESSHPHTVNALQLVDADNGSQMTDSYLIPSDWAVLLPDIEKFFAGLTDEEMETMCMGEETDRQSIIKSHLNGDVANDFLTAYFDDWFVEEEEND